MGKTVSLALDGGTAIKAALDKYSDRLRDGGLVKVGFLEGATYPEGIDVAQVAFWQEFGNKRMPARPFFRPMIAKNSKNWGVLLGIALNRNKFNVKKALTMVGGVIADELTNAIVTTPQQPLSAVTLMLRKMKDQDSSLVVTGATVAEAAARVAAGESGATGTRAKPLIDRGIMQRAPDFEVVMR